MNISAFNYIESGLWVLMAAIVLSAMVRCGRSSAYFGVMSVAIFSFVAFGVSDIIEAQTGAWWRPLWLLVLKSVCVVALVGCYIRYKQIKRTGD